MSLQLVPVKKLPFHGPYAEPTKTTLTIRNDNWMPVTFKIKTTALKIFTVNPNMGRIEPGESVDVTVTLYATKDKTPLHARDHDKFLIQSAFIGFDSPTDYRSLWKTPNDAGNKLDIHEQKLTAVYLGLLGDGESRSVRPPSRRGSSGRDEAKSESQRSRGSIYFDTDVQSSSRPGTGQTDRNTQDVEQQLRDARDEIRYLRTLLARSDGGHSVNSTTRTLERPASKMQSITAVLRSLFKRLFSRPEVVKKW